MAVPTNIGGRPGSTSMQTRLEAAEGRVADLEAADKNVFAAADAMQLEVEVTRESLRCMVVHGRCTGGARAVLGQ